MDLLEFVKPLQLRGIPAAERHVDRQDLQTALLAFDGADCLIPERAGAVEIVRADQWHEILRPVDILFDGCRPCVSRTDALEVQKNLMVQIG